MPVIDILETPDGPLWGHFTAQGVHVGPWYRSEAEAMADHAAYLLRAGWIDREK